MDASVLQAQALPLLYFEDVDTRCFCNIWKLVPIYQTTPRHILEHYNPKAHSCDNLKCQD
jgi:hypothetical protein